MSTYLEQLDARKATAANRMREILDGAAAENRELSAEEDANLATIDADLSRYNEERDRFVALEAKANQEGEVRSIIEQAVSASPVVAAGPSDSELFARAFQAFRSSGSTTVFESHLSEAFARSLQTRALGVAGGSAVPTTFLDQVTVYERTGTPMLNPDVVTLLPTRTGNAITLPRLTADVSYGGSVTAEAGTIAEADPTISSVQLDSYKFPSITLWSAELDLDEVIGLEGLIAQSTSRELTLDIGTSLTTDNGSSKPNGFINAAANGGTASGTANNTFIGPDDIIDLFFGRAEPYRRVGTWQASSTGLAKIRKLKDANGQYMWVQGLAGAPDTVLGRPIYENPAMAAVASASKSVAFGDFKRYWVRKVTPTRVEVSKDYKFNTDQIAVKVVERVDGDLVDTAAIAYLVSANA
jgi:HK97 family phage major capsid protein